MNSAFYVDVFCVK